MGIVKMNHLTLVGLVREKDAIINTLSKLGAVDMKESDDQATWQAKVSLDRSRLMQLQEQRQLLETMIPVARDMLPFAKPMFDLKRSVSMRDFLQYQHPELQATTLESAEKLKENRRQYAEKEATLASYRLQRDVLAPWSEALGDAEVNNSGRIRSWLGKISNNIIYDKLMLSLAEQPFTADLTVLMNKDSKQAIYALLSAPVSAGEQPYLFAQQMGFQPLQQKRPDLTPQNELTRCERKIEEYESKLEILQNEAKQLAHHVAAFEELSDYLAVEIEKLEADAKILNSDRLFVIEGYMPEHLTKGAKKGIEETYCANLDIRPIDNSEEYPIQLNNGWFARPYEAVIEMFSLPNASEVDPTPVVAPFYALFFGMMFSDVAYGIIFCIITAFLVYKVKVQGGLRKMCQMFFQCGLSSIVWGILFGGFFGNLINAFTNSTIIKPVWFDPMSDPTKMMVWSVIFGALHIFVGLGVKIKILIATGKTKEAILDVVPWYLILAGLGALGYGVSSASAQVTAIGKYMAIAGAVIILLFAGRSVKNPILRILKGVGSLYDITGYFSDVMSYTRILALCLSTSVIAMVVNLLALLPGKNLVGIIFFIVISILGHTLNFALSALSAYVHTTRLHYVEFFGKFYEGGGRQFQPLAYHTKYVLIDLPAEEPAVSESLKTRFARFISAE